jgi:hypothetical protein
MALHPEFIKTIADGLANRDNEIERLNAEVEKLKSEVAYRKHSAQIWAVNTQLFMDKAAMLEKKATALRKALSLAHDFLSGSLHDLGVDDPLGGDVLKACRRALGGWDESCRRKE